MRKLALLGFLLVAITACKSNKNVTEKKNNTNTSEKPSPNQDVTNRIVYFKATGNEPFWGLEISEDGIEFKSLTELETFKAPHTEPIRAMDANVKMYRLKTETGEMNIQIIQGNCENSMSGSILPYSVTIEIKKGTDAEFTTFKGCGQYVTDYRLHDIWVLEQLNGKKSKQC
jgi:heat shock protein HslJ